MNPQIVIRDETAAEVSAITKVTIAAFKTLEISKHTEQFIIAALRAFKALTVSLVAEVDGRVIGHIAFSPVTISDGTANWYGLWRTVRRFNTSMVARSVIDTSFEKIVRHLR